MKPQGQIASLQRLLARFRSRRPPAPRPDPANFPPSFRPYKVRAPMAERADRPRIAHIIANLYTGGSARLVVDLVERLGAFEHVVVVRTMPPELHYVGLDTMQAPSVTDTAQALAILRRHKPDLVHVHFLGHDKDKYGRGDWDWYEPFFRAAEAYGRPVIENVNIPVAPYISDAVRCYVYVSDYVRKRFGRDEDRNITIYPGSDVDLFSQSSEATSDGRIGMVYRLEQDKLDESAIDVFIEVIRRRPHTTATIVGGGRWLEPYRERVRVAGLEEAFSFPAYVSYEELPSHYSKLSVFVAPPHTESFGHVVPLAMSMGIPVAAYAVGALPEILGDERVLAPAGDVTSLAAKIVELLDDPALSRELGAANRERARRLFSVEKMASDYEKLYEELLA